MSTDKSAARILLVEDESALLEMLRMILEGEGYHVDVAINGREAWHLMQEVRYDLLSTDLYMPVMNGVELIQKCQADYPSTKIILFSGGGRDLDAELGDRQVVFQGQEVNVDLFIKKPCDLTQIVALYQQVLAS